MAARATVPVSLEACIREEIHAHLHTGYVNQNPSAFVNAYWDVAAVRVYQ
jgi:hypothetical protein